MQGKRRTGGDTGKDLQTLGVSLPKHQLDWLDTMADSLEVPRSHLVHGIILHYRNDYDTQTAARHLKRYIYRGMYGDSSVHKPTREVRGNSRFD
jgi:hypothetical protein